ncbi:MAG TPA: aminotransferase class V-fold PLP-dependent enzyme [bacterium]|nr:aminotransferase class V-fold PLP-dependent enzyme [bacterium]
MPPLDNATIQRYRELFPVTQHWVYLNHAGVGPISRRVAEAVEIYNREALEQGYTRGGAWHQRVEEIRRSCASLVGAEPGEVAFVKNTSHGLSLAARGLELGEGDEVLISDLEFPANVYPWMALEKRGVVLKKIPARNGGLDLGRLADLMSERTKVLCLSSVAYGTGYRLPLAEVGKLCRDLGVFFAVDAIQSLGAFPIDVERDHIDFLSADAHKWMLGHEGIGMIFVRKAWLDRIEPALLGWNSVAGCLDFDRIDFRLKSDARRYEEGSQNGLSIYGMGAAVELLLEVGVERIAGRILELTEILIAGLGEMGCRLRTPLEPALRSGIVSFDLADDPEKRKLQDLERLLYENGIYAAIRAGGLRLSPHFYNTEDEMRHALATIQKGLNR